MLLEKTRDVIEWQLDDTLDINGWDLEKAPRLLHKSNPTLFEWNESPIVYQTTEVWSMPRPLIHDCFLEKSGLYHYISLAKSNYREHLCGDVVKLKKYFYVLRPVMASRWILERKSAPPVAFSALKDACLPKQLTADVERLLERKMSSMDMAEGLRIEPLNAFLDESILEISKAVKALLSTPQNPWENLNPMFYRLIRECRP